MNTEHVSLGYKYSPPYRNVDDDFGYVKPVKHTNKNSSRKILFVLDYVPKEDLRTGRLMSGSTGVLFKRIANVASKYYKSEVKANDVNWMAISFHSFKTAGTSQNFKEEAQKEFARRLRYTIAEYKPDTVVTFGLDPYKALNSNLIDNHNGKYHHFFGIPVETKISYKKKSHTFNHVPTISLNTMVNDQGSGSEMAVSGYVARNLVNGLNSELKYRIPNPSYNTTTIDTIPKFKKMLSVLRKSQRVAIDTETKNLNRIANTMLTIQFAASTKRAFVLPYMHKDSPFTGSEIRYIRKKLRKFFESENKNQYHVYCNAVFDLNVIRNACGVRYFKNNVWDIFAGEFCHDENLKFLSSVGGKYYYSLLNISMQYGCRAYYDAEFGKEQRKTISNADLDDKLLEYCSLDVIVPLHIMDAQLRRARDIGYDKYSSIVSEQISDMLHSFSVFEHNGVYTDIDYLFYLKTKDSPIRGEIRKIEERLKNTKNVQKANQILAKDKGMPSVGLFGKSSSDLFDINKEDHKRLLFFDILGLKPLGYGKPDKDGKRIGSIDKNFQETYIDVEEVKLYSDLQKAYKLYNSYVKAFIKNWGSDEDMRKDRRIRPHFEFLGVVTGRTSAKDPSLHQIPARSELGKHIKRVFIAEDGRIIIKVDYAAHEVRGWALFTGDKDVAGLFDKGIKLRKKYKAKPDAKTAERINTEGDVHKINASYFFGVDINQVDKKIRTAVKQVIFGLIYQQGLKGLAASTGQTTSTIEKLVNQFKKSYPVGVSWFDSIKDFARKNLYVESPLGRRRHLWGLLVPEDAPNADSCRGRNERQSVNSPIQGMGSDFLINGSRQVERLKFEYYQENGHYPDFYQANSVHDSISFSVAIEDFWLAVDIIERGLTDEVANVAKERHNMDFIVPLEIDFEIGANERDVMEWDYSLDNLEKILKQTFKDKKNIGHELITKKQIDNVLYRQYEYMPSWAKKQAKNTGRNVVRSTAEKECAS